MSRTSRDAMMSEESMQTTTRKSRRSVWISVAGLLLFSFLAGPSFADNASTKCDRVASRIDRFEYLAERFERRAPRFADYIRKIVDLYQAEYTESCVAMNQIQSLGTHNSYHQQPQQSLLDILLGISPFFGAWEYTHAPLDEQLESQGIRQLELDVFRDPLGGLYGIRIGAAISGGNPVAPEEMFAPGFKVLHVQELDFETTCLTFIECLTTIKTWSDANQNHLPITIMVEPKDDPIDDPNGLGFVTPVPYDAASLDELDNAILSVFPEDYLIRPDDVRVAGFTLDESVRKFGWPSLRESRGRIMFAMDNDSELRDIYRSERPSLEGRVMFTRSTEGEDDGAFIVVNGPVDSFDRIRDLVSQGYIVRTRADADTTEARFGLTDRRDSAIASGAQFVSTDFPTPDTVFGTGYQVEIPDGNPSRCNPVNAPRRCREANLE